MHFLLLGATGRTGKHILDRALEEGLTVHALVRDKQKIKSSSPRLILLKVVLQTNTHWPQP